MLELKEKVVNYKEYFIDLSKNTGDLYISWESDNPFVMLSNNNEPPYLTCHIDNLDNLISGLKLLREKIKK